MPPPGGSRCSLARLSGSAPDPGHRRRFRLLRGKKNRPARVGHGGLTRRAPAPRRAAQRFVWAACAAAPAWGAKCHAVAAVQPLHGSFQMHCGAQCCASGLTQGCNANLEQGIATAAWHWVMLQRPTEPLKEPMLSSDLQSSILSSGLSLCWFLAILPPDSNQRFCFEHSAKSMTKLLVPCSSTALSSLLVRWKSTLFESQKKLMLCKF